MSTYTTGQMWGKLRKAWKMYKIAKIQGNKELMKKCQTVIRECQTNLGALEGLYWKNQHRYEAAQKKKAERSQARAVYRQEHQPTKLQVIEEKISKAEQHKKELETRIKRLRTAVKKSNRRIAGLKVALRKAILPKEAP